MLEYKNVTWKSAGAMCFGLCLGFGYRGHLVNEHLAIPSNERAPTSDKLSTNEIMRANKKPKKKKKIMKKKLAENHFKQPTRTLQGQPY